VAGATFQQKVLKDGLLRDVHAITSPAACVEGKEHVASQDPFFNDEADIADEVLETDDHLNG
jgi:hypothetical protein